MKKIVYVALTMLVATSCSQLNYGSIAGNTSENNNQTTTSSSSSSSSVLGNILGSLLGSDDVKLSQLEGTWNYSSPAVGFQSEDVLKSIGGSAASATIENKLATYYEKLGLNKVVLTMDANGNFSMKTKYATLSGVAEKGQNGIFVFNFKALGAINLGKLDVYTSLSGNTLSLTCDAKKVVEIAKKVSSFTNNTTLQSVITLLDSYDGITIGFKLKK